MDSSDAKSDMGNSAPKSSADSSGSEPSRSMSPDEVRADLTAQLDDLLNSLSNKFAGVSSEIFAKMDEMTRRLDNIETALTASQDEIRKA